MLYVRKMRKTDMKTRGLLFVYRRNRKMRRSRLAVAAMLLAAMTCGALAGCGEQAKIEKPLDSATAEEVAQIAAGDERLTGELSNKTIKWMANWDINPDATGKSTPIELAIFQSRYGGKVEYVPVDWRYSISTYIAPFASAWNVWSGSLARSTIVPLPVMFATVRLCPFRSSDMSAESVRFVDVQSASAARMYLTVCALGAAWLPIA
jgi:hypothetical protein